MMLPSPLRFSPIDKPKPWGKEIWTLADLDAAAFSDPSPKEERSLIDAGPFLGRTLQSLLSEDPKRLVGDLTLTPQGGFPLLCKILEAKADLSLQVHPTQAYAAKHPSVRAKSEAWYVTDAADGAGIYLGLKQGVSRAELESAVLNGRAADLLMHRPVQKGDLYYLPAGTCHALGAGVRVFEVQTPSDTTFRLYDWHREPRRELHLKEALCCIDFNPWSMDPQKCSFHELGAGWQRTGLLQTPDFNLALCSIDRSSFLASGLSVWMLLEGSVSLGGVEISSGQTALIPFGFRGIVAGTASWIEVTFPCGG